MELETLEKGERRHQACPKKGQEQQGLFSQRPHSLLPAGPKVGFGFRFGGHPLQGCSST